MYDDKSYNPPIMFAVEESELQRFRELETKNNLLKVQTECLAIENERLKQEYEQLKAQIEKMKCCENCKHSYHDRYHNLQCIRNCINFDKWELAE